MRLDERELRLNVGSGGLVHGALATTMHAELPGSHSVHPLDLDMVAQALLHWAGSCRQQPLHACATVHSTYMQRFRTAPLGKESGPHPYLRVGLRAPHSLVLSMARLRLSSLVAITWG
jgi:hypothetical protein